jgi:hypothetical protein
MCHKSRIPRTYPRCSGDATGEPGFSRAFLRSRTFADDRASGMGMGMGAVPALSPKPLR